MDDASGSPEVVALLLLIPKYLLGHTANEQSSVVSTLLRRRHGSHLTPPFKLLMTQRMCECKGVEFMFQLFRVSVSIFLGLTDRPINLIYRVSLHPLTSSTGLLSGNELL